MNSTVIGTQISGSQQYRATCSVGIPFLDVAFGGHDCVFNDGPSLFLIAEIIFGKNVRPSLVGAVGFANRPRALARSWLEV